MASMSVFSLSRAATKASVAATVRTMASASNSFVVANNRRQLDIVEEAQYNENFVKPESRFGERIGRDIALNWTLARLGMPPFGDAFRNADMKHLLGRSYGDLDANKALVAPGVREAAPELVIEAESEKAVKEGEAKSWPSSLKATYLASSRRLENELHDHFSKQGTVFVEDGAVAGLKVRIVADNSNSALFFRHLLEQVTLGEAKSFNPQVTLYVASGLEWEFDSLREEFRGPKISQIGTQSERFVWLRPSHHSAFVAGTADNALARDVLSHLAARVSAASSSLVVSGNAVSTKAGQAVLVVGDNASTSATLNRADLFAAHAASWSSSGVSRLFRGSSVVSKQASSLSRGTLVERLQDGTVAVTQSFSSSSSSLPAAAVVLVTSDSSLPAVSTASGEQAAELYASSLSSSSPFVPAVAREQAQQIFSTLATASGAPVYIVQSSSLQKTLDALAAGQKVEAAQLKKK